MANDFLVGIDIGSTNIKCAVYDLGGKIVSIQSEPTWSAYETMEIKPQRQFIPEELWNITSRVCTQALGKLSGSYSVRGVAVASVGCTAIMLDKNGDAVTFHPTDDEIADAFLEIGLTKEEYFKETGYPLDQDNSGFFIAACSKKEKFKRVYKILSVADYICFRLTGEFSREYSTAASMGLFSVKANGWWIDYINQLGISESILGKPVNGGECIGKVTSKSAEVCKIPKGTGVFAGGHDYPCAAFACNVKEDDVLNIFGTVEIMSLFTDHPRTDLFDEQYRTIIDHHVIPNRYSYMTEAIGAGNAEWLRRNVTTCSNADLFDWDQYLSEVDKLPSSFIQTKEIFIPQVYGRMIPNVDRNLSGAFLFLNKQTNNLSMMRAVVEGLAYQSKSMFEVITKAYKNARRLVQIGGGTRQPSWVQIRANVLGIPIFVPNITESTAMGAALLAGVGGGVYSGVDEAMEVVRTLGGKLYEPDRQKNELYSAIYNDVYVPAVENLEVVEKRLNKIINNYRRNEG